MAAVESTKATDGDAKESPSELFKRSLAQTTRALAGAEEELEVTFGAEGPRLSPGKIVLPHPPMPQIHLSRSDIADLATYIETLKSQ